MMENMNKDFIKAGESELMAGVENMELVFLKEPNNIGDTEFIRSKKGITIGGQFYSKEEIPLKFKTF